MSDAPRQTSLVPPPASETVEGVVERVVYADESSGWTVIRLRVEDRVPPLLTAVGSLGEVRPGERLRLRGAMAIDRRFGEQLRVDTWLAMQPSTLEGIERYLGSGMVKGIGRAMASRLVARFGLETLDVIERRPERLAEVEGIGPVRSRSIRDAWVAQGEIREVMVFLQAQGVATSMAGRIYRRYGKEALRVVREDPYRLAEEVVGIGFRTADRIAASLGISGAAPRRVRAGVLHLLDEARGQGHCFLPRGDLVERAVALLEIEVEPVEQAISGLVLEGPVALEARGEAPAAVYSSTLLRAERAVADALLRLLAVGPADADTDPAPLIARFEERRSITLAAGQRRALTLALRCGVTVITGGPGTGKTTILGALLAILEQQGRRVLLAAPTGRAAKRLSQVSGREARTLHRLLEFNPKLGGFDRCPTRPLDTDAVIVDEASMLDLPLLFSLLAALPAGCRLILVGDVDQLPSVGPGAILRDIIASRVVPVAALGEVFRQAQESGIIRAAHAILGGEMPDTSPTAEGDFFLVERDQDGDVMRAIREVVGERIPRRFGLDPVDDIQVLAPMHRGSLGAQSLNVELQALLNPTGALGPRSLRVGDKVMQLRNNYDLDVFNGDLGRILSFDEEEGTVSIRFDDRVVAYPDDELDDLTLAYACSVHKSQGSEYPAVVLVLHTQHFVMLQRNLLYTAVTRGRRLVVVVGNRRAVGIALRNSETKLRHTLLAERLQAGEGGGGGDATASRGRAG